MLQVEALAFTTSNITSSLCNFTGCKVSSIQMDKWESVSLLRILNHFIFREVCAVENNRCFKSIKKNGGMEVFLASNHMAQSVEQPNCNVRRLPIHFTLYLTRSTYIGASVRNHFECQYLSYVEILHDHSLNPDVSSAMEHVWGGAGGWTALWQTDAICRGSALGRGRASEMELHSCSLTGPGWQLHKKPEACSGGTDMLCALDLRENRTLL